MGYRILLMFGEELTQEVTVSYKGETWAIKSSDWPPDKYVGLQLKRYAYNIDWHTVKVSLSAEEMEEERERMRTDGRL